MWNNIRKVFRLKPPEPPAKRFPPVPKWRPDFRPPLDAVVERMRFYTNGERDLAVFENGTCVILPNGLSDEDAHIAALNVLSAIFNYHADMNPRVMKDGNVLVTYNHPAANVVLKDFALMHWAEIDARHLDALAESEVMLNAKGQPNAFDEQGKLGLFGRCFMFMDAQAPKIVLIERAKT